MPPSRSRLSSVRTGVACLAVVIAPALAVAADKSEGGAESHMGPVSLPFAGVAPAITALLVFGIVLYILSASVWPKIQGGLKDREDKIREEIASAEAARAAAKAALEEYEKSLSGARAEAQRMLEETKAQQSALAAELRAKSEAELTAMRQRAMSDIESARKAALAEIYQESVALAATMASKVLERQITIEDRERLINESLADLDKARAN